MDSSLPNPSIYIDTLIGRIRISGTADFISEVHFCDEQEDGTDAPDAPPLLRECAAQLLGYAVGSRQNFDLPLQQPGTEFQQKVWAELQKIPYGQTITYLQLARRLGDEKSIRAAGTANGKNNIAIIVPCHRVIGTDGSLTGYAGGLFRKEWLLRHEGSWPVGGQGELF
jgi:methylated-DNA-[protein]-cysteine S-methyltransferase